nr:ROK family protein [Flexivirga aerilata]
MHLHGQLSRSELARLTGLNRSTIGGLVGDLADLGMVSQRSPTRNRDGAGRPAYLVVPRPRSVHVVAVDVDVESVQVAAIGLTGRVLDQIGWQLRDDNRSPVAVVDDVAAAVRELSAGLRRSQRVGIGASVPAMVHNPEGVAVYAPNLEWSNEPFGGLLEQRLGEPVLVGNDADLATLAEHRRGAAAGFGHVVCVLGRVGVGGGIIVAGHLLHGGRGYAGELGHMSLQADGPLCHCGNHGCLEEYVGEAAILRAAGEAGLESIDLPTLFSRAELGDPDARDVVAGVARWFGRGLANLANVLNPEAFVASGHLAEVLRIAEPSVREGLERGMVTIGRAPITLLQGGIRDASLVGAAELAFEELLAAPDLLGTPRSAG